MPAKVNEERLQREKIQGREKKEQKEREEKLSREGLEREKEREELERKQREETKVREPQSLPKKRQSKLPAPPRHSSAVKVELIEDDKDQVGQVAQATGGVGAVSTPAGDAARDPRTRPSRSHDPRLQDQEDDAETSVKVFVDPYLENPHPDPEPDTALSVEVLRQPLAQAQAVPKRQRRAAPKKAVAKHPPPSTTSLPLTPLTPALPSEEKLLEIKQLLQRETQPLPMTGSKQPLPGLPAPTMSRTLPAPTPEPQDSHAIN